MNNDWIDDLSEEEESVLSKLHSIDELIRKNKPLKIGLIKGIK